MLACSEVENMGSNSFVLIIPIVCIITFPSLIQQVRCEHGGVFDSHRFADIIARYFSQENIDYACLLANETIHKQAEQDKQFLKYRVDKLPSRSGGPSHFHATFSRAADRYSKAARYLGRSNEVALKSILAGLSLSKKERRSFLKRFRGGGFLANFHVYLASQYKAKVTCDFKNETIVKFRTADGTCNNVLKPELGQAVRAFNRFVFPEYDDDVGSPRINGVYGYPLPSARLVSRVVHTDDTSEESSELTHMVMQWAQFLDHDITATPMVFGEDGSEINCCEEDFMSSLDLDALREQGVSEDELKALIDLREGCFPISIPPGDPAFERDCMNFVRSLPAPPTKDKLAQREQRNDITAFIDSSNVYGSSDEEQRILRAGKGGLLAVTPDLGSGDLLPQDRRDDIACVIESPDNLCFRAGDGRSNEFITLTTMHILWLREHNRIALELAKLHKYWDDERLFQETRRIIGAFHQKITYDDFLPIVLGTKLANELKQKREQYDGYSLGYNVKEDPTINNAFATAAFRMGHSYINGMLTRVDENFITTGFTPLMSGDNFFKPAAIYDNSQDGPNSILRGLLVDSNQEFDRFMTSEVTTRLFETRFGGRNLALDLAALNIQRGRDHGVPGYMTFRKFCNLTVVKNFPSLPDHDAKTRYLLSKVYKSVNDIDLFAGGLSERRLAGAQIGPTFGCLLAEQFRSLKEGDRFFFENKPKDYVYHRNKPRYPNQHSRYSKTRPTKVPVQGFSRAELREIRKMTLSCAVCANVPVSEIQPDAFRSPTVYRNQRVPCSQIPLPNLRVFDSTKAFNRILDEQPHYPPYPPRYTPYPPRYGPYPPRNRPYPPRYTPYPGYPWPKRG